MEHVKLVAWGCLFALMYFFPFRYIFKSAGGELGVLEYLKATWGKMLAACAVYFCIYCGWGFIQWVADFWKQVPLPEIDYAWAVPLGLGGHWIVKIAHRQLQNIISKFIGK